MIDTGKIIDVLNNENNRKAVKLLLGKSVQLIKHIFPKKMNGDLTFGFEDPYYTGIALSCMAMVPPAFENVDVTPLFNESRFEGGLSFKGRMRLSYILSLMMQVWFNKDFRRSEIWQQIHKSE